MGKTIDTSELLYRMGKYAEIDVGEEEHNAFMHFMLLLTRTIEKMPNAALTHKNPIDDEIMENQYKLVNAMVIIVLKLESFATMKCMSCKQVLRKEKAQRNLHAVCLSQNLI